MHSYQEELAHREADVALREAALARKETTLFLDKEIYVHRALGRIFQQLAMVHQGRIEQLQWQRGDVGYITAGEEQAIERS